MDPVARSPMVRSRSWTGRSRSSMQGRSQSPAGSVGRFDAMSGSGVSRLEANQGMRERAASMWLDQLRGTHDKRREAARRNAEIQEMKRNKAQSQIDYEESMYDFNRTKHNEYLNNRREAFAERQEYLKQAKDHSQMLQSMKQHQIEMDVALRQENADRNHQQMLDKKAENAMTRNKEREGLVRRNNSLIKKRTESMRRSVTMRRETREQELEDERRREDEERMMLAASREQHRRKTLDRAEQIANHKKSATEAKLRFDGNRSSSVLKRREEWLRSKQQQGVEREYQVKQQVAHAQMLRKVKEKQYENHFEESIAIGKETAEHNKLFKLNNRIMHEMMQGIIADAKANDRRSRRSNSLAGSQRRH